MHRRNIKSVVRASQGVAHFFFTVVQHHVKATRKRNDQLLLFLKGVATAALSTGDIVNPVATANLERNMIFRFDKTQISPIVEDLGKRKNLRYLSLIHTSSKYKKARRVGGPF